jgi:pentatricopeptide repeat protein
MASESTTPSTAADNPNGGPSGGPNGNPNGESKKRKMEDKESSFGPKPKKQARIKPTQQVLLIRRTLQGCCARNNLPRAMQVYQQANEEGTLVEAQSLYNLLNLCDGLGDRPVHIGTPKTSKSGESDDDEATTTAEPKKELDTKTRHSFAFLIKKDMDDRQLPLNETAYTALIRMLAKAQRVDEADQLLRQAESTQQCKMRLRLYSSLLATYCELGQLEKAIDLWVRLESHKLIMTERDYTVLMQCATKAGNAPLLERFLSELSEDVLIPSKETIQALVEWFQSDPASPTTTITPSSCDESATTTVMVNKPPPCTVPIMGPVVASTPWTIDFGCTVKDGVLQTGCLQGQTLQPVPLSQRAWQEMIDYNETIVLQGMVNGHESGFQGGGKGPKRKVDPIARLGHWNKFKEFLDDNYKDGLDVVIDGANIGYYKQNFSNAPKHVDYRQIDGVIRHFVKQGKKVLLVLHARHFSHKLMPAWAKPVVEGWSKILYKANPGMNDDWFWLHAALWGNAAVLTNDEMRDHHFQMLAPRSFLRWKERHQIHFNFELIEGTRALELSHPAKYSRRIQRIEDGLVIPLAKQGDENRFLDGAHVADDDEPDEETYLCIRPSKA